MRNKNKNTFGLLFFLLLATVFLSLPSSIKGESHLIINEILLSSGTGKSTEEFIEIYNPTSSDINLKDLPLKLHIVNSSASNYSDTSKTLTFINNIVPSNGYFLITSKDYAESKDNDGKSDVTYSASSNSLVSDGAIYISTSTKEKENIIDFIGLGNNTYFDKHIIDNPENGKSIERVDFDKDDWQESYCLGGTPGKENSKKEDCDDNNPDDKSPSEYAGKAIINEIFPAPDTKDGLYKEEFVEIKNISGKNIDFSDWTVKDSKNTTPKISKKSSSGDFFVFYGMFSLNNDKNGDTVVLYDNKGKEADKKEYTGTTSNKSYSFDGSLWRWTSKITPEKENEFDKILEGKIEMNEKIYAGLAANFEAKADKDAKKFTWDWGDGHHSYVKKPSHKYEESGEYNASLKITGNGEDVVYNFTVAVENYNAPNVKIIAINPNPKGNDTENETITLLNKSKNKVNLLNWSIATGWDNLYNHPIRKDFFLKKNENKNLTKKYCAFTLNNTQSKIELRDPTGNVVQKIKYDRRENKIVEDETFELVGKKWEWNKPQNNTEEKQKSEESKPQGNTNLGAKSPIGDLAPKNPEEIVVATEEEIKSNLGKYSANPNWQNKRKNQIILLSYHSQIKTPKIILTNEPKILGASIEKIPPQEKHWMVKFINSIWMKINSELNLVLNKL